MMGRRSLDSDAEIPVSFFPLSRCDHPGSCCSHTLSEETSSPAFCSKQHRWTLDNNSQDWCILPLCAILSPDGVSVTSSQGRLGGDPSTNAIFVGGVDGKSEGWVEADGRFPGFASRLIFFSMEISISQGWGWCWNSIAINGCNHATWGRGVTVPPCLPNLFEATPWTGTHSLEGQPAGDVGSGCELLLEVDD